MAKRTIYYQIDKKQPILSPPLFSMLYGWGFAQAFLISLALSNGERGGEFETKEEEVLLWPQYYRRDCLDFKNLRTLIIF